MRNFSNLYFFLILLVVFQCPMRSNAQEDSIQVGATTRKMIIHAPSGIEQNRPLVISMHGLHQTMHDQKNQTQFGTVADANKFVLVYPQAIDNSWQLWGTGDTDFILAIIDEMDKRYHIDRDRVYLTGFSMGGMMSYYAVTKIAYKIAAIGPVGGFLMGGPDTNSSRPVPIIHIHGADDDFVPHSRVQECMDAWIARNNCPATPVVTDPYPSDQSSSTSKKYYWGPGDEGVEMIFISVGGVGHWYSDNPNGIFSSQEIWDFFQKFSLNNQDQSVTGLGSAITEDDNIHIHPNPANNKITIQSADFSYDSVELLDITGNVVLSRFSTSASEIQLPANLINGTYLVKISKGSQYRIKKIIIRTKE